MQAHLLESVACIPAHVGAHGAQFRTLRASGAAPVAGLHDLMAMADKPWLLQQFNPFLSAASHTNLQEGILVWLQLCVLEDRLGRLHMLLRGGADYLPMLIQVRQNMAYVCWMRSGVCARSAFASADPGEKLISFQG